MGKIEHFRRPTRPGWTRPSRSDEGGKRLRGLDEFVKPEFVGRMDRIRRRRQLAWYSMLAAAVVLGGYMGWTLI